MEVCSQLFITFPNRKENNEIIYSEYKASYNFIVTTEKGKKTKIKTIQLEKQPRQAEYPNGTKRAAN